MWDEGYITIEGHKIKFVVKHSPVPSELNIGGRWVSKLRIYSPTDEESQVHAEFDRGQWLQKPDNATTRQIVQFLLRMFN